jgi:biopolymer transport protein ExbD
VDAPWFEPLVLRIDKQNRWFLNDQPVSPEGFSGALKGALSRRPEWFVYLDADPELEFGVHALAIDLIQGLHAKTILVTPNARNELLRRSRQPRIPKEK